MREHTVKALTLLPLTPLAKLNSKAAGKGAASWGLPLRAQPERGRQRESGERNPTSLWDREVKNNHSFHYIAF